jgi:GGDEF domain-containing protein
VEVLRQIRAHPPTVSLPVILLTGRSDPADKVIGLTAGADDYVVKPFDTLELIARIAGTLRRTADIRALSPLTGLPGNHRIDVEVSSRAAAGVPYALCHVDLDEFKGFNDAYGFQRGDDLLLLLASCLQKAVSRAGFPLPFLGHLGGDDFVVVCTPDQAEPLCGAAVGEFDEVSPYKYDPDDAARGYLEVLDRRGEPRRQPLASVSVGVAMDRHGTRDFRAVIQAATEMKKVAKEHPGSHVAVDRRQ